MCAMKATQNKAFESTVFDLISSTFSEYKCTLMDIKVPKKDFVIPFYIFLLEQLQISPSKAMLVSQKHMPVQAIINSQLVLFIHLNVCLILLFQKPLESQLQNEKHPEIFTDIQQLVNLSHLLRTIIVKFQNPGDIVFGLDDLLNPSMVLFEVSCDLILELFPNQFLKQTILFLFFFFFF